MTAPERIWAAWKEDFGAVQIGTWADTVRFEPLGTEYIRADLVQALVDDAMKRALYATRDRTWSGVEALISDPDALRAIGEDQE